MKASKRLLAGVVVLVACGSTGPNCTLIGCLGALTVAFGTPPTGPYHMELVSVQSGQRTYDCADAAGKCATAIFPYYTPDLVIVTISDGSGSKQYNVTPAYTDSYPNGKSCGAACRSATVTLAAP